MKNFVATMMICRGRIYEKKDRAAADVYILVKDFVESGKYSRCRRASELVTMQLRGYNDKNIAERYNISTETVRVERRQISNELWSIFGLDFFDRLLNYRENKEYINKCLMGIKSFDIRLAGTVLGEVIKESKFAYNDFENGFERSEVSAYNSEDMQDEVDFLRRYSYAFLEEDLKRVDLGKLHYLLEVLDGNKGTFIDRAELIDDMGITV